MALRKKDNKKQEHQQGIIVADNPFSIVAEQMRTIRTNIHFSMIDQALRSLLVTSATAGAGKTTLASNLAAAFAAEGRKVLLVAADMRKPRIHKVFGVQNKVGLTNLLTDRDLKVSNVARQSYIENLDFITCGVIPPNPAELLNSNRMTELIEEMEAAYDLVIFDSPPLLAVTDSQILASKTDGTLVVVPSGEVTREELDQAREQLGNVNANVLGTVMNKVELEAKSYYYYESDQVD